jgi:hypothetical protein
MINGVSISSSKKSLNAAHGGFLLETEDDVVASGRRVEIIPVETADPLGVLFEPGDCTFSYGTADSETRPVRSTTFAVVETWVSVSATVSCVKSPPPKVGDSLVKKSKSVSFPLLDNKLALLSSIHCQMSGTLQNSGGF